MTDLPQLIADAKLARAAFDAWTEADGEWERVVRKAAADMSDAILADWAISHGEALLRLAEAARKMHVMFDVLCGPVESPAVYIAAVDAHRAASDEFRAALAALPDGRAG